MKELYLLRGIPGAGKSTLAKSIGGIHMEADQYFMEDGKYNFDVTQLKNAHNYCQSQTKAWMRTDSEQVNALKIVVSNTFTQEWEMEAYYEMAKEYGYTVYSLIVENRHGGKSEHNVPKASLDKMENRFEIKLR
jgi:predicted kinase